MATSNVGNRRRIGVLVGVAAVMGVGLGLGTAALVSRTASAPTSAPTATSGPGGSATYDYYRSMMAGAYGGSMMGGSNAWMTGAAGYQWMMGGAQAPAWMTGSALPGFMMGTSGDPGQAMGQFWANAPGARVTAADAARLATAAPAGATVDAAANTLTFSTRDAQVAVVTGLQPGDDAFQIAGLRNPKVVVPAGATVRIELVNGDGDSAHGFVVTAAPTTQSAMPMMTAPTAFSGAALWFLGASTPAGMHEGAITFTADRPGAYAYLCPVPLHAQHGMLGTLVVGAAS